tara:strand:- start:35 stop:262 length:228 start_codon:yes stop_codon:yes gene_type:complete
MGGKSSLVDTRTYEIGIKTGLKYAPKLGVFGGVFLLLINKKQLTHTETIKILLKSLISLGLGSNLVGGSRVVTLL